MKNAIKILALITTGLVVGVVVGRESKKKNKLLSVSITDLDVYKKFLKETQDELNRIKGSIEI